MQLRVRKKELIEYLERDCTHQLNIYLVRYDNLTQKVDLIAYNTDTYAYDSLGIINHSTFLNFTRADGPPERFSRKAVQSKLEGPVLVRARTRMHGLSTFHKEYYELNEVWRNFKW